MTTRHRPELLRVVWSDAFGLGAEWMPQRDAADQKTLLIETVGFVVTEDKSRIVLAGSLDLDNENVSDVIVIPKRMIVDRFVLEKAQEIEVS